MAGAVGGGVILTDLEQEGREKVAKRLVFFVSGFDPNGPRRYHNLYRTEAARQAAISGYEIKVGPLTYPARRGVCKWSARTEACETQVMMLRWDDIARDRMRMRLPALYLVMARTLWRYVGSGAFAALSRLRTISTWVGIYPVAMMLLYLGLAIGLGALTASGLAALSGAPLWATAAIIPAVVWAAMRPTRLIDEHALVYYLMCDFGFTAAEAAGEAPEMEARLDEFAARIRAARREEWDEILIVGHSSGASYAAAATARALDGPGARLSLLTLGQTIPMLSFLPGAKALRAELALLARSADLDWIDISTPADGACYALSDPAAVSGVAPAERRNPKVISARFADALSKEAAEGMKGRWFRKHIQYLCAFERPAEFDYFQITAGPQRLAARFAHRRKSPKAKLEPYIQKRLRAV